MKLVKYLLVLLCGVALGLSLDQFNNDKDNDGVIFNDNNSDLEKEKNIKKQEVGERSITSKVSSNQELLSQVAELTDQNTKLQTRLHDIQGLIGTLDKVTLSNLISMATLENRYLSESNIDDDLEVVRSIKSYIQDRPLSEKSILDDFITEKSPSVTFDKVKEKLSDHIDDKKDVDWAYQAEEFLKKYFISNVNDFSLQSVICLTKYCEIIGSVQNYDTSRPETDIAIMERDIELSKRMRPVFIGLIKDPNYFELLTDRVYGPYFSILENYNQPTIPFVIYIDRSARSMDLENLRYD